MDERSSIKNIQCFTVPSLQESDIETDIADIELWSVSAIAVATIAEKLFTYQRNKKLNFSSNFAVICNRPLSRGGHFESQENKKLCFCPSSLALDGRLDGQILLFQYCVIKFNERS